MRPGGRTESAVIWGLRGAAADTEPYVAAVTSEEQMLTEKCVFACLLIQTVAVDTMAGLVYGGIPGMPAGKVPYQPLQLF